MAIGTISGDCIDNITSRGGRNSGISFLGNTTIKILAVDPSFARPPEFYEYDRFVDHVYIGNHFGFQIQLTFYLVLKASADAPNFGYWRWTFFCDVDINYPDGYTKSQTVSLGTELIDPLVYHFKDVSFPITFSSTIVFDNQQRCNLTEDPTYGYYPPFLSLDLYEIIPSTTVPTISVTVTGLDSATVTENAHALGVNATTEYDYTIDTELHSRGATAGVQPLQINNLTLNELALPDYTYLHLINSNNYFYQTTSVDSKVQGTDDVFGGSIRNEITASTSVTLERSISNKGVVNAWQNSYSPSLTVDIDGFDLTTRTVNFSGGSFDESEIFQKYNFTSTITIAGTGNTQTLAFNNLPAGYIQNTITPGSLIANGDYEFANRLPFRAWWKPGADIYHIKDTVLPGSGNTRTYNDGYSFSSYRFLEVTAGNATTLPQAGKLLISQNGTNTILEKDLIWPVGTSTTRIDTCFAGIAHTLFPDIQGQDNPYPRINIFWGLFPGSGTALTINQDMYGVGQIQSISATGNITVSQYKLTRDDNSGKATLLAPFSAGQGSAGNTTNGFVNWMTDSPTRTFNSRRFWEQDVQGKNDEEWDIEYQYFLTTGNLAGINKYSVDDFCVQGIGRYGRMPSGNIYPIHNGWSATALYSGTADSQYLDSRFNKGAAYASWLNGNGLQFTNGISKYSILRDLSEEHGDRDIYTQMIFDRINCNYPPDYFDPFSIEPPETRLLLYSFSCLRSAAHGLVQERQSGQVVGLASTTGSLWGDGTTDIIGSYQTGSPQGKAENPAVVSWLTNSYNIPKLFTSKRTRVAFYGIPVPADVTILSADISGFYQQCIGTISSGNVDLIFTETPDFSTFDTLSTNITGMTNVAIAWLHPTNSNQMILITQRTSDSAILRYVLDDFVNGVAGMATVIGNGTTPAIAINGNGTQIIFWRTSSSNIQRIIIDSAGNISTAASNVVVGNVDDKGLGCYWNDDVPYLVYNHTVNGLTVVKSDDYGQTFS